MKLSHQSRNLALSAGLLLVAIASAQQAWPPSQVSCPTSADAGDTVNCTVSGPTAVGNVVVTIGTTTPGMFSSIPSTVTVQSGQSSAQFPVTLAEDAPSGDANVNATSGGTTKNASMVVYGIDPSRK